MGIYMRLQSNLFAKMILAILTLVVGPLHSSATAQFAPEMFELESFVEAGNWESETGKRVVRSLIGMATGELEDLERLEAGGLLETSSLDRKRNLELILNSVLAPDLPPLKYRISTPAVIASAKTIFANLGQEKISKRVNLSLSRSAYLKSKKAQPTAYSPNTPLKVEAILQSLSLSEIQKSKFNKLYDEATEKMRFGSEREFRKLENLLSIHWGNLLFVLDSNQNETARNVFGEPVQWFRNGNQKSLKGKDFSAGYYFKGTYEQRTFLDKNGRTIRQLTPDQIRENGFEYIHSHVEVMLKNKFVWDELDLSTEQRHVFKKSLYAVSTNGHHRSRLLKLLQGKAEYAKVIGDELLDNQVEILRHLEVQVLTSKDSSSVGLLFPDVADFLSLTKHQKEEIRSLAVDYERQAKSLLEVIAEERKRIQIIFDSEVENLLTDSQFELLGKLTGR